MFRQSSPFFSKATLDGTSKIAAQAGAKRALEVHDVASMPLIISRQAVPANKRQSNDSREQNNVGSEVESPAKSSAKGVAGGQYEELFPYESSQRTRRPSADRDYEERRLHDRVSREEAGIFRSAKSYGQRVEKRRRLGN